MQGASLHRRHGFRGVKDVLRTQRAFRSARAAALSRGEIIGYTVGNDLSCRDIEGENPLYLPQAKCFKLCAALGPAILIQNEAPAPTTRIHLQIDRTGTAAFEGETTVSQLNSTPAELAGFLFRDNTFPTGTGIVPGDEFTLQSGDIISIPIEGIGALVNPMA